jgi:hypothetical protein
MKYFTKEAFLGFGKKTEAPPPPVTPYKTYAQTIESLPTYALKKRLYNLKASADAYGNNTMPEEVLVDFNSKVQPILNELKSRGEKVI